MVVNANINPNDYENAVKKGKTDLEGFWEEAAMELDWFKKWDKVLDRSEAPFFKWFANAKTNIAYNALDRHVYGSANTLQRVEAWISFQAFPRCSYGRG